MRKVLGSKIKKDVKMFADKIFSIKGDVDKRSKIYSLLAEIGKVKGYEVSLEHKIVGDLRLDAAYIKNGATVAAFEVVLMRNLKEALFKPGLVNAKAKFLAVRRDKSSKVQKILRGIKVIELEVVAEAKRSIAALAALLDEIGKALNESNRSALS